MVGLHAARFDPAWVFLSGWRRAAVFPRQPIGEGAVAAADDCACCLASLAAGAIGYFFAFGRPAANEFHVRGYAVADRAGLCPAVPFGINDTEMELAGAGCHPGWLLDGVCHVSAAGPRLRLHGRRGARKLAASLQRLCGALEQKLQSSLGVRHLVS